MLVDMNSALMESLVRVLLNVSVTAATVPQSSKRAAMADLILELGPNN